MSSLKTPTGDLKKIEVPLEPKKAQADVLAKKQKVIYIPVPKEYADDPFLTVMQVAAILQYSRAKAYFLVKNKMKHFWDGGNLRTRRSWLEEWIKDHTEEPSEFG